jgi:hypothetical protein
MTAELEAEKIIEIRSGYKAKKTGSLVRVTDSL